MTAILASVDHKTMWSDSACTDGSLIPKLYRHKREIIGISGTVSAARIAIKWYIGGQIEDKKPVFSTDDDFTLLILRENGIAMLDKTLTEMPVNNPVWHAGSGGVVAYTAFLCGKTPQEAIEMACFIDNACRPPVQSLTIGRRGKKCITF